MIVAIKKQQEKAAFIFSIALISLSLLSLSLVGSNLWLMISCVLFYFVAFNFLEATMPALVSRLSPAGQKGSAMGLYSSAQFLGAFLGGLIGGVVAEVATTKTVFAAATMVGLIWLLIAWGMVIPLKSKLISLFAKLQENEQSTSPTVAAKRLASELSNLPGVLETTVVPEENRAYLKVKESEFDLQRAKAVANIV